MCQTWSVFSTSRMRAVSRLPLGPSKRHSSTAVAFSENRAKFTPDPSQVAPSGYELPGQALTGGARRGAMHGALYGAGRHALRPIGIKLTGLGIFASPVGGLPGGLEG